MNDAMNQFELFDKLSDKFFWRLLIDVLSMVVLVRFIYFRIYKKKDYLFTFFLFNIIIFIITYLMNKVDMSLGAAFGLFAVFSMLRYRTEGISTKDMTYLFIVIAIGLICAVSKGTYFELSLIKPENYNALIDDLKKRTGLNIHRASVNRIDFLKDIAVVKIYYYEDSMPKISIKK